MSNGNLLKVVGGIALTGVGAYGAYKVGTLYKKVNKLCARLDTTFTELCTIDDISINQAIVDAATKEAAADATCKAVKNANKELVEEASKEIKAALDVEIEKVKGDLEPMVKESLTKQVADIDIYELRRDVKKAAKEQVVTKLATSYFLD